MSRSDVTLHPMGGLQGEMTAETQGIDVTRRAESIGDGISLGEDLHIVHLEVDLVWERDRPVTLPCHAPLSRCSVVFVLSPRFQAIYGCSTPLQASYLYMS